MRGFLNDIWYLIKDYYSTIRGWFYYNFNNYFFNTIRTVLTSYPYDYAFNLRIEKSRIIEMIEYFKKSNEYFDHDNDIFYMNICVNLIDTILSDGDHLYDIRYKNMNSTNECNDNSTDNKIEYVYNRNINIKNIGRYLKYTNFKTIDEATKFYEKYKVEFYLLKARVLFYRIKLEKEYGWWD